MNISSRHSKLLNFLTLLQGRSQPHSPGRARVPLSSFFLQISINFSYFSSNFSYFLPHFGPPGGRLAHPERPCLRHCPFDFDYHTNFARKNQFLIDGFSVMWTILSVYILKSEQWITIWWANFELECLLLIIIQLLRDNLLYLIYSNLKFQVTCKKTDFGCYCLYITGLHQDLKPCVHAGDVMHDWNTMTLDAHVATCTFELAHVVARERLLTRATRLVYWKLIMFVMNWTANHAWDMKHVWDLEGKTSDETI